MWAKHGAQLSLLSVFLFTLALLQNRATELDVSQAASLYLNYLCSLFLVSLYK